MPLSYSQLRLYQTCPRKYEYAFVKKITRPQSPGESFGSSMHNTLKKWGELEMEAAAAQEPSLQEQTMLFQAEETPLARNALSLETMIALWHQNFIVDSYPTRLEADFARKRGEALIPSIYEWWRRESRQVLAVEKGFTLHSDTISLSGRFDRVEVTSDGVRVIDFKTGSSRSQDEVDADLQLSVYALATAETFKKPCIELSLLFIGEEGVTERRTTRNASQLEDALKQIRLLADRIASRDYHPTPSYEKCSVCPYKGICDASAAP